MHIQITTPWAGCIALMTLVAGDLPASEFTIRAPQWGPREQWTEVSPDAAWAARPGHQAVVLANDIYVLGGFGIRADPANPFKPSNPMDL